MFSPFNLPDGVIVLITDELPSPADFVLHQSLITHFKNFKNRKRIILSVSEHLTRWQAISAKSNVNWTQQTNLGLLQFIDLSSLLKSRMNAADDTPLRSIYEMVVSALDSEDIDPGALVILDDISSLEWIGYPVLELISFCRALRALCLKKNATLLIRHHIVTPGEPDTLFRQLLQLCTYHMDVRPLSSGRSGAVSGEVALHAGPSLVPQSSVRLIPRSAAMQYRLTDNSVLFFERGSSRGVL